MHAFPERDAQSISRSLVRYAFRVVPWLIVCTVRTPDVWGDTPADAKPSPTFDVAELRVLGNSTLAAKDIEAAIYPFTGPAKRMADIEAARTALERTYHERG